MQNSSEEQDLIPRIKKSRSGQLVTGNWQISLLKKCVSQFNRYDHHIG
jgi:hypothetical protein